MRAHLCLHHMCAMESQIKDDTVDIHRVSGVQLLKDSIESDKGPGPAHASTVSEKQQANIH